MERSRSRFLTLASSSLVLALPSRARAQSAGVLRVASTASDSYAEALYARDQGFFERAGLNVELSILASGSAIAGAVAAGAVDIGVTNPIPLALAYLHGIPFAYFCAGGLYNPDETALCVLSDGPIKTAKDLEGKTIAATALADANTLAVKAWVDQNGGDSTTLRLVELPFSEMRAALQRGTVAAAPIVEPALSNAKKEGGIRVLLPPFWNVFGRNFLVGGWFARTDWLKANAGLARRYAATIYATGKWANEHPNESADILAKAAKLDPQVVRGMGRAPYGDALTPAMIQSMLDSMYKYKLIDRPLNGSEVIYKL
jgi:NitT/TauT family transport system substrate-binding protein